MGVQPYDFSGYVTKYGVKCSDDRTIRNGAFKRCDGLTVPLVFQHCHNDIDNVLGKVLLEHRDNDGVYGYGSFNGTPKGSNAKIQVEHRDLTSLSIFANQLKERDKDVYHGMIREVSLCLAGANPEAYIDNLTINHGDGIEEFSETEAIIAPSEKDTDLTLYHAEEEEEPDSEEVEEKEEAEEEKNKEDDDVAKEVEHADKEMTIQDVLDSFTPEQRTVLEYFVGQALEEKGGEIKQSDDLEGGDSEMAMKQNVFDQKEATNTLSHDQLNGILTQAYNEKAKSLKEVFLAHATTYGIDNIEVLFPEARNLTNPPEWVKREDDWVPGVINGTRKTPFSRIKSVTADITADEARAKGYIKGAQKLEEVFPVMSRVTTPCTIYKKQKLDRDDIIDITDFDVVQWIRQEMRMMLDEEIARAILIGDGREITDPDKIQDGSTGAGVRPIWTDDDFYVVHVVIPADATPDMFVDAILRAQIDYKGSGGITYYTTKGNVIDMLLIKDGFGRRLYNNEADLAIAMGVNNVVSSVDVMRDQTRVVSGETRKLIGIGVNLRDYTVGADRGGQVAMFDDFDIDYNQYKYLIETRISGALIRHKSAIVIEQVQAEG